MIKELPIDRLLLRKGTLAIRAINNKFRLQMLRLIHRNKKMTVTEIYTKLNLEQAVASQHLAVLRRSAFVSTDKQGKFVYYSVEEKRIAEMLRLMKEVPLQPARSAV